MRHVRFLPLALLLGCGPTSTPAGIDSYFPKANEVGSWAEDTSSGKAGVEVARTGTAAEGLVNGDAAPFIEKGMVAFAWEKYASGANKLDARLWQMKNASTATDTYNHLVANVSLYKANTWTAVTVGEEGRVADTGSTWWLNARKGAYIIEAKVNPKDTQTRADVEAFAKAMAAKLP